MSKPITLSQPLALASKVSVSRDTGVIENVAILSPGPAAGHGFDVDSVMVRQCRDALKSGAQINMHVTHAHAQGGMFDLPPDPLLSRVASVLGETARIENGVCRADIKLGKYSEHSPIGNMREFILSMAEESPSSIGLSIVFSPGEFEQRTDEHNRSLPPAGRIKELLAVDFVGDPGANPEGLLSAHHSPKEKRFMDEQEKQEQEKPEQKPEKLSLQLENKIDLQAERDKAAKEALALERKRCDEIDGIGESVGLGAAWCKEMKNGGFTIDQAREAALKKLATVNKPVEIHGAVNFVRNTSLDSLVSGITDAVCLRAGIKIDKPHERSAMLSKVTIIDNMRHYLQALGVEDAFTLSRPEVANLLSPREMRHKYPHAFTLAQSTSDFTSILENSMRKSFLQIFADAEKTWPIWAKRAQTDDYKLISRAMISESPSLVARNEGGEIRYVALSDGKETYQLQEYAGGICLTRIAIINDDLSAFSVVTREQAMAASRLEDDVAYSILTANANMADGGALFNATATTTAGGHDNLISSGTAVSVATLGVASGKMFKQKGLKNAARLELRAKYLLCPGSKQWDIAQVINSTSDPSKNNAAYNPFSGSLVIVPSARLEENSATAWYLISDSIQTVEMCFLRGEEQPVFSQETDFDTDDAKFKVRHSCAAKALDWRGMVKNNGA